jgi:ABC-2 type transport system permease protein
MSKGIEFVASLPVLIVFAVVSGATVHWNAVLFVPAILLQAVLTLGLGLIIAPLVVFFRDLEPAVKLILRFGFYASPIVYSTLDLPENLSNWAGLNPLSGLFSLYRAAWFPEELDWSLVGMSALTSVLLLLIGLAVFRRTLPAVLKEI